MRENELVYDQYVDLRDSQADGETPADERKRARGTPSYVDMPWDDIDKSLAGKMEVQPLCAWALRQGLAWMSPLEQLKPGFVPEAHPPNADGTPRVKTRVRVAPWLGKQRIQQLVGVLLVAATSVAGYVGAACGLFGVPKPLKNVLRVIFDARPANESLVPRGEQLVLFTLSMLVGGVALYPFIHTVDYRHYYYQFAIPVRLAWYFFARIDGEYWLPRVLPMGFREAVTIAQSATWAVVLYIEPGESRLGVDFNALRALPAMPAFVSLYDDDRKEVGRIYVLLDGVCVACSDDRLRERWIKRLRRNEDLFHVIRKETHDADLRQPGSKIEFAGVFFSQVGWWPRAEIPEPTPIGVREPARALASRLGRALWALRVRGAMDPGRRGPLQYDTLMALYSVLGVAAAQGWNATVTLPEEHRAYLIRLEETLRRAQPQPWGSVPRWPSPQQVWLLATDAHPRGYGFVLYDARGAVAQSRHHGTKRHEQVDAEACAVAWALETLVRRRNARPTAVVVAVDADTIRNAINKGYARTSTLREALRGAFALCDWMVAVRVPGVENAADAPSRNKQLAPAHVEATWNILRAYASSLAGGRPAAV